MPLAPGSQVRKLRNVDDSNFSATREIAANALIANEAEIEGLDRAIGDGDHFHNMKRGAETVIRLANELRDVPADAALKAIAAKLLSTIGGASGPLTASFFLAASKTDGVAGPWDLKLVARLVGDGVEAIRKRGGANRGDKTMLDVLIGVAETLKSCAEPRGCGARGLQCRADCGGTGYGIDAQSARNPRPCRLSWRARHRPYRSGGGVVLRDDGCDLRRARTGGSLIVRP